MDFFRGDDRGPDDVSMKEGFTAKPPSRPMTPAQALQYLADKIKINANILTLGMTWRESTPGDLIATAQTQEGGFQGKNYFYKVTIPDNELTLHSLNPKGVFGPPLPIAEGLTTSKFYIVANHQNIQQATIIGFRHGMVHTKEVTFLTTIPRKYIVGYRTGKDTTKEDIPFTPVR